MVWWEGLMLKLNRLRVKGILWKIIDDCHLNTVNSIVLNQCQSKLFQVNEGVRKGGVL